MKREASVISWERLEGKLHFDEAMTFGVVSKSFLQGKDIFIYVRFLAGEMGG